MNKNKIFIEAYKMETQINKPRISDKEISLKKMALSQNQDGVTKLALSDKEERKNLWESWKAKHPESKKTWRTDRNQRSDTLR